MRVLHPGAKAENMPVRIGYRRTEAGFRDGILTVDVTAAQTEPVFKLISTTEFVEETRFPIEGNARAENVGLQIHRVQSVPIRPVNVDLEIPVGGGPKRPSGDDIVGKAKAGGRFFAKVGNLRVAGKVHRRRTAITHAE